MKSQTTKGDLYRSSKMPFIKKGMAIMSILFFITACSKSTDAVNSNPPAALDCSGPVKTFSGDVKPVIQAACGGCHGAGSLNGPGALTNYAEIFNFRSAIRTAVSTGTMPLTGSLTSAEKSSIICWIDNGAPNN